MKTVTRIFLLLLLMGLIPISFYSCDSCNCTDQKATYYHSIDSFYVESWGAKNSRLINDTSYFYSYESSFIAIAVIKTHLITQHLKEKTLPFSLASVALACDCATPPPDNYLKEHITSINIISKSDVLYNSDISIKTGKDISNIFKAKNGILSSDSIINTTNIPKPISQFLKEKSLPIRTGREQIALILSEKPSNPVRLMFDVNLKLSDGRTFLFENQVMKIE